MVTSVHLGGYLASSLYLTISPYFPSLFYSLKKKKKKEIEEAYKTTNQEQKKINKSDNYKS